MTLKLQGFTQGWRRKVRDEIDPRLGAPGPQPSVPSCCLLLALEVACASTGYKGELWEGGVVLGNMAGKSNGSWLPLTHRTKAEVQTAEVVGWERHSSSEHCPSGGCCCGSSQTVPH